MSRTAPQNPNNIFTPNAITVATSTGFNQGDLVYQSNTGNFGRIPDNAISSDTFNISQNSPILAAPNSGSVIAANTTGSSYGNYAATLSNGNIVQVYQRDSQPRFKITDVNNTIVVAETSISTTFLTYFASVSVAALTGGGFVATWINTLSGGTVNSVCYAVYTNTGTVTLAATQDLTLGSGTFSGNVYLSYALALPNGNFVLAAPDSSNIARYRIYNANGTGAYAAGANTGSNFYFPAWPLSLAARSDSSFIILGTNGGTIGYFITSATNTAITNSSFTSTLAPTSIRALSATCLTNGTTFVIGYAGTNASNVNFSLYRFLPTGNVLSSETLFTNGISTTGSFPFQSVTVQSLASGNFIFLASENGGLINYAVFNSSGVCISGTSAGSAIPKRIWAGQVRKIGNWNTVIVTSSSINIYWTYSNDVSIGVWGLVQSLVRLNLTSYDPIPVLGTTVTLGTTTAGVSGYNIATATPTSAKFSAASTSLITSTQEMAYVRSETAISSSSCYGLHSATLTNGNFVVAYVNRNAPYPITAAIYTPAGTLITSFTASATGTTANANVKVAALSGGGFVVTYATGAGSPFTLNNAVYSSSGSLVGTSVVTTTGYLDNSGWGFSVAGITSNRFVVVWNNDTSNNISFRVFDSSGVALTASAGTGYGGLKPSIAAYAAGGFAISYFASNQQIARLNETSTNVFSAAASYNFPSAQSNALSYAQLAVNSNNQAAMITYNSAGSTAWYVAMPYDVDGNFWNLSTSAVQFGGLLTAAPSYSCCFTAYGNVVIFNAAIGTPQFNAYPVGVNGNTNNITTTFQYFGSTITTSTSEAQTQINPLYGNVILVTYKDSSNIPRFFTLNAAPYTATQQLTAGVTASNGVGLGQPMGYSLAGVAASTATAGGTGLIQTNGVATLNSSYNASTPAQNFDFQNNTGVGVKGTISGRTVNLQGNI